MLLFFLYSKGGEILKDIDEDISNGVDSEDLSKNASYRTLTILESLSFHNGIILEELAPLVNLSRATLFRFLQVLQKTGYVDKDKYGRYRLTAKIFMLASRSIDDVELSRLAKPYIEDLSYFTGETTILGIIDEDTELHLQKIESRYSARFYERIGKRTPLYCTAMGKVLIAGMSDEQLDSYLSRVRLIPYTVNTVTSTAVLKKQVLKIREDGYAEANSEYEQDVHSLACPVLDANNNVIASLSINWPLFRDTEGKRDIYLQKLKDAALSISKIMGYVPTEEKSH